MEPLTTTAMIGGIVTFLGKKLSENKSINNFLSEFTEATVNWIKPIFLNKDGREKEIIRNLKEKPESPARKKAVETAIEIGLEDKPKAAAEAINEIFEKIRKTEEGGEIVYNIINSNSIIGNVVGNVIQTYNDKKDK